MFINAAWRAYFYFSFNITEYNNSFNAHLSLDKEPQSKLFMLQPCLLLCLFDCYQEHTWL